MIALSLASLILIVAGFVCFLAGFRHWRSGEKFFARQDLWSATATKAKFEANGYQLVRFGGILAGLGGACGAVYWLSRIMQ